MKSHCLRCRMYWWPNWIWELWMHWWSHRRWEFWIHRSSSTTLLRWPIWLTARLVSAHFVMTRSDRQYWHSTSARGYITTLSASRMWNWGGVMGWWRLVEGWGRGCGSWRGVIVGRGGSRGRLVVCRWWSGGSLIHRGGCRGSLNYKIIFRNKFWVEKTAYSYNETWIRKHTKHFITFFRVQTSKLLTSMQTKLIFLIFYSKFQLNLSNWNHFKKF